MSDGPECLKTSGMTTSSKDSVSPAIEVIKKEPCDEEVLTEEETVQQGGQAEPFNASDGEVVVQDDMGKVADKRKAAEERMAAAKRFKKGNISMKYETKTQHLHCKPTWPMPSNEGLTEEEKDEAKTKWLNIEYVDKFDSKSSQTDISAMDKGGPESVHKPEMIDRNTQTEVEKSHFSERSTQTEEQKPQTGE